MILKNLSYTDLSEIDTLINQFLSNQLPADQWTHEAHLTVALWHINEFDIDEATCRLRSGIIIYNHTTQKENTGQQGYHETLTLFWIKVISSYLKQNGEINILDKVNGFLSGPFCRKDLALQYYSKDLLFSKAARAFWAEPDLQGLNF